MAAGVFSSSSSSSKPFYRLSDAKHSTLYDWESAISKLEERIVEETRGEYGGGKGGSGSMSCVKSISDALKDTTDALERKDLDEAFRKLGLARHLIATAQAIQTNSLDDKREDDERTKRKTLRHWQKAYWDVFERAREVTHQVFVDDSKIEGADDPSDDHSMGYVMTIAETIKDINDRFQEIDS